MSITLRAQNLRKTYKKRTVVKNVSIHVDAGEVVGLLGPNGAGKTTSFYMIVGLVPGKAILRVHNVLARPAFDRIQVNESLVADHTSQREPCLRRS